MATIASGVKPNFFCRSFRGAEAPKVCIPIIAPPVPTKRSQPNVEACSTETRARHAGGSTSSLYSGGCWSNSSQDGMLTTRTFSPSAVSCS